MKTTMPTTEKIAELERRIQRLEAALADIAEGRWNTAHRSLGTTSTQHTFREYARAALKDAS